MAKIISEEEAGKAAELIGKYLKRKVSEDKNTKDDREVKEAQITINNYIKQLRQRNKKNA